MAQELLDKVTTEELGEILLVVLVEAVVELEQSVEQVLLVLMRLEEMVVLVCNLLLPALLFIMLVVVVDALKVAELGVQVVKVVAAMVEARETQRVLPQPQTRVVAVVVLLVLVLLVGLGVLELLFFLYQLLHIQE